MPRGLNGHRSLVVAAEDSRELEFFTEDVAFQHLYAHVFQPLGIVFQQEVVRMVCGRGCHRNTGSYLALVVDADVGSPGHRGIVTAAIDVGNGASPDIEERLA